MSDTCDVCFRKVRIGDLQAVRDSQWHRCVDCQYARLEPVVYNAQSALEMFRRGVFPFQRSLRYFLVKHGGASLPCEEIERYFEKWGLEMKAVQVRMEINTGRADFYYCIVNHREP